MFRKGKKRHSSSSSQGSEISTKSKSVDSSLGGLSRSSTVASLDTDSTRSSGQSNSNFDTCTEFRVKYLGAIENLKASFFECLQGPQDLINYIDLAQDILHRHPLYLIVRMICYDDGLGMGKSLLAIKTTDANQNEYSICVYQCNSLDQAQTICKVLSTAFDSALSSEKS
ncbi:integrin beta-1-binding protein 1 isoform X2 [Heterodontus francisci]|uniref:integrin beta-1-binding protein 1 isoform X2 n=1 Tax=Heterodontus francisci TaxID=7792 RepID=UPI00355B7D09